MSACSNIELFDDATVSQSPLQFILPTNVGSLDGSMGSTVGAVFWNVLVVAGITVTHGLIVVFVWKVSNKSLTDVRSMLMFPNITLFVIVFIVQGTTFYVVKHFTHPQDSAKDVWFVMPAVGALIIPIGVTGFAWYMISRGRVGL
eukprot:PhF_6_TR36479/c0_g1_i1/m.53574